MKRNIACYWAHAIHHVILSPLCVDGSALACILCYTLLYLSLSLHINIQVEGDDCLYPQTRIGNAQSLPFFLFFFVSSKTTTQHWKKKKINVAMKNIWRLCLMAST